MRDDRGRFILGSGKAEKNARWNEGKTKNRGYVYVNMPSHPRSNSKGYVQRSHLIWEMNTGSWPPKGFHVHHINGIKSDDRFENLKLLSPQEHMSEHSFWPHFCMSCGKDGRPVGRGLCRSCYNYERTNETLSFWKRRPNVG